MCSILKGKVTTNSFNLVNSPKDKCQKQSNYVGIEHFGNIRKISSKSIVIFSFRKYITMSVSPMIVKFGI